MKLKGLQGKNKKKKKKYKKKTKYKKKKKKKEEEVQVRGIRSRKGRECMKLNDKEQDIRLHLLAR